MSQDLYGLEMGVYDESDWEAAQANDLLLEQQEIAEAFQHIYNAIDRLETLDNAQYPDLRKDVRFVELTMWRK